MKKRIKNKAVRKMLRTIANWDNCPIDCRRNWGATILDGAFGLAVGFIFVMFFFFLIIIFG